jgi:hypothetical protein
MEALAQLGLAYAPTTAASWTSQTRRTCAFYVQHSLSRLLLRASIYFNCDVSNMALLKRAVRVLLQTVIIVTYSLLPTTERCGAQPCSARQTIFEPSMHNWLDCGAASGVSKWPSRD